MATHPRAATSPIGWTALPTPGAWVKVLVPASSSDADAFALLRLAPGAEVVLDVSDRDRFFVVSGTVDLGREIGQRYTGDYLAPGTGALTVSAPGSAAVLLRLTGSALGAASLDASGPEGWFRAGAAGLWAKLFIAMPADLSTFDERLAGLTWFEPGGVSDPHPHPTAHRFLFLSGSAEDEVVFPDGRREVASRAAGDFVDYPVGIEHSTRSAQGCLLLFVHEAVAEG